jgi:hypothetical protein
VVLMAAYVLRLANLMLVFGAFSLFMIRLFVE